MFSTKQFHKTVLERQCCLFIDDYLVFGCVSDAETLSWFTNLKICTGFCHVELEGS